MRMHGILAVVCAVGGALLLALGGLVPAHVRAIDRELLARAGADTPTVSDLARKAEREGRIGLSLRLRQAAAPRVPPAAGSPPSSNATANAAASVPALAPAPAGTPSWGRPVAWLDEQLGPSMPRSTTTAEALPVVLEWALPPGSRAALLRPLSASSDPTVMALVACRKLERTEVFPPVPSAAGQPLDAALLIAASLAETRSLHGGLGLEWERAASAAIQARGTAPLERAMLDLLAAARHLDWDSLTSLAERSEDAASLSMLGSVAGVEGRDWGTLLALVQANGSVRGVAEHIRRHGDRGLEDLREALTAGTGAVPALIAHGGRIHHGWLRPRVVSAMGLRGVADWLNHTTAKVPRLALAVKYLLWIDGVFLVLFGGWHARRLLAGPLARRFEPRPDYRVLIASALAVGVLIFLAVEQYLVLRRAPPNARHTVWQPPLRARLRVDLPKTPTKLMNEKMIAMLVAFFVIQLVLYLIGLARLRRVRGQAVEPPVKLRLVDNEESLFDAPLYMGIAGSVLALVLKLTGFEGISLMASYSSTLFGILFCFILKVMHVRPYKQQLILESAEYPPA